MGLEIHVKSNIQKRFHLVLFVSKVPWVLFMNNHFRCFILEHENFEFENFLFNFESTAGRVDVDKNSHVLQVQVVSSTERLFHY